MTQRRPRRRAPRPLGTAALLAGMVVLAVTVIPGTLSSFRDAASTSPVAVTTGSAALQIGRTAGQAVASVYPAGPAAPIDSAVPMTVTNTGDVPLAISAGVAAAGATSANFAGAVVLSVALQTGTTCPALPATGTWSGGSGAASGTLGTLAVAQTQRVCVWQSLPATAPAGSINQSATVTLTLTGTQQGS